MTEDKIALIDKICRLHPSLGVDKGWSDYTGGMKDSGEWHFRQMLDVPIEELQEFYDARVLHQEQWEAAAIKEKEEFEASGMTSYEWMHHQWDKMDREISIRLADAFFTEFIDNGKIEIKPKDQ